MVHVGATRNGAPIEVVFQKLDIVAVHPACGADVERTFPNLLDGRDARQRQEEAEVVGEVGVGAGADFASGKVFGLEVRPTSRQNELGLGRCRACLECGQGRADRTRWGDGDMDMVGLKDAAKQAGCVGFPFAQALEGRFLVTEGLQEGERELAAVERLLGQGRYGFFDLDGVHFGVLSCSALSWSDRSGLP